MMVELLNLKILVQRNFFCTREHLKKKKPTKFFPDGHLQQDELFLFLLGLWPPGLSDPVSLIRCCSCRCDSGEMLRRRCCSCFDCKTRSVIDRNISSTLMFSFAEVSNSLTFICNDTNTKDVGARIFYAKTRKLSWLGMNQEHIN